MHAISKRVTSADVARRSGVSRTTVSFVLNDTPDQTIPKRTRDKVLRAASELGYIRSPAGLALAKGRTDLIVLDLGLIPLSEYHLGQFARMFSQRVEEYGATVVLHSSRFDQRESLLRLARATQPFAIVSFDPELAHLESQLRSAGVHLIQGVDFESVRDRNDWMRDAARLHLRHLAERGHRRVAYAHPHQSELTPITQLRMSALRDAAPEFDLQLTSAVTVGINRAATVLSLADWRARNPDTTAVICYNDDVGLAVLSALHDHGISVPREVAVIGTDDVPIAQYAIPALTTLHADAGAGAGPVASSLLMAMGYDVDIAPSPTVFTLVVREST